MGDLSDHRSVGGVCLADGEDWPCSAVGGVSDPDGGRPPSAEPSLWYDELAAEMFEGLRRVSLSVDPHDLGRAFTEVLHRRGVTVCDESAPAVSSQEAWNAGWDAAMAAWGVSRGTSGREGGTTEDEGLVAKLLSVGPLEMTGVAREATVTPIRACVALGGRRSTVCGKPVDDGAEGDLCPVHQEEATAIGRDLVSLLTRLRWSRDDRR